MRRNTNHPFQLNHDDPIITLSTTGYNMSKLYILSQGMHFCVLKESHQDKQRYVLHRSAAARLLRL